MRLSRATIVACTALALTGAAAPQATRHRAEPTSSHWIATWGTSQLPLEAKDMLPPVRGGTGVTVRQTVRVATGGTTLRLRLSNAFGREPLRVGRARVATTGGSAPVTFSGRPSADIPAGAELYSDPVALPVGARGDLTISLHLPSPPECGTGHPGARSTTSVAPGDQVDAATLTGGQAVTRWFAIADVEVRAPATAGTIVAIGDSITDGYGVQPDTHARWTDAFAERLRGSTALSGWGVVNAGIGGNRVTLDGVGPNLLARFDRDVIARSGVKYAILLEGINDLGTLTRDAPASPAEHAALVNRITAGFTEVVARAHAHGIKVIGGTVMPFGGNNHYHPGRENEADRQAVNAFIRHSGTFDGVIDFDAVVRDPAHPDRLALAYDSGDHLHPSIAGYRAMAAAVPLSLFTPAGTTTTATAPAIARTFDDMSAHGDLDTPSPAECREQLAGNEAAVAAANAREPARWFRYPFLAEESCARMLPPTLALYRTRGFRFVGLYEALADPISAAASDPRLPGPSLALDRLAAEAGLTTPPPLPSPALGKLCQ